jgi:CheY-like chemotaxis protein
VGYHHKYQFNLVDEESGEVYDLASGGSIGERVGLTPHRTILVQKNSNVTPATVPITGDLEILICEETPGSLEYLEKQLHNLGFLPSRICHNEPGQDKVATAAKFDIIFAGILSPGLIKSYDFSRSIRESMNVYQKTPVIAVTERTAELPMLGVFDAVLKKSPGESQLLEIISRLCNAVRALEISMEAALGQFQGDPMSLAFEYLRRTVYWWSSPEQFASSIRIRK